MQPVLVTGATGRIGRAVIAELLGAGVPVRALTRRPATAALPAMAEVVAGDYVLTGPESLSQAEQVSVIGGVLGRQIRFEELSAEQFRRETAGTWPGPVVEMLLDAWGATIGRPALVTSTVADVAGAPARTFRQWVSDHADAFRRSPPE